MRLKAASLPNEVVLNLNISSEESEKKKFNKNVINARNIVQAVKHLHKSKFPNADKKYMWPNAMKILAQKPSILAYWATKVKAKSRFKVFFINRRTYDKFMKFIKLYGIYIPYGLRRLIFNMHDYTSVFDIKVKLSTRSRGDTQQAQEPSTAGSRQSRTRTRGSTASIPTWNCNQDDTSIQPHGKYKMFPTNVLNEQKFPNNFWTQTPKLFEPSGVPNPVIPHHSASIFGPKPLIKPAKFTFSPDPMISQFWKNFMINQNCPQ